MDKENIVEDSIRNNESKFIKSSVRIVENGMYSCNSYNKENNNGFDSKLIVIKNNVKLIVKDSVEIVVKSNVKIVKNGVYNRKMEYIEK